MAIHQHHRKDQRQLCGDGREAWYIQRCCVILLTAGMNHTYVMIKTTDNSAPVKRTKVIQLLLYSWEYPKKYVCIQSPAIRSVSSLSGKKSVFKCTVFVSPLPVEADCFSPDNYHRGREAVIGANYSGIVPATHHEHCINLPTHLPIRHTPRSLLSHANHLRERKLT